MSVKDTFHDIVKIALQKEEWTITHDPLTVSYGGVDMHIDLGAERLIAAEKEGEKIAIEVKNFLNPSAISEFHTALGQFINYRAALRVKEPNRTLYLAVPFEAYNEFFQLQFTQLIIQDYQLYLIVYDVDREEVVRWQK